MNTEALFAHVPMPGPPLSTKVLALLLAGGLQALVVWAFAQTRMVEAQLTGLPIQVVAVEMPQRKPETLPTPLPQLDVPTPPLLIEPDIQIESPPTHSITVRVATSDAAEDRPASATHVPKLVTSVRYVREPTAKYPPAARALKQHGTVYLRALVDTDGRARQVDIHRSSGYRLLDDAARLAVQAALFKPYTENGHALPVYVIVPIEFGAA